MKKIRIETLYQAELAKKGITKKVLDERKRLAEEVLPVTIKEVRRGRRRCVIGPTARAHRAAWFAAEAIQKHVS